MAGVIWYDLAEKLVDLPAASLHPLTTASAGVLPDCGVEVPDDLEKAIGVRIVRDEELEELLCLVH